MSLTRPLCILQVQNSLKYSLMCKLTLVEAEFVTLMQLNKLITVEKVMLVRLQHLHHEM